MAAGSVDVCPVASAYGPFADFGNDVPLILPSAIAFDLQGNLYIAETAGHVVRKVDATGNIMTIAGTGAQRFRGRWRTGNSRSP